MDAPVAISIVIPAFNEEKRLPIFLDQVVAYCQHAEKRHEIIVVDDGSRDHTFHIAMSYRATYPNLSVVRLTKNQGKGYAVKRGLLKARGRICLFLDADGSVSPAEITKNVHYLEEGPYELFVGSRVLTDRQQTLQIQWYRKCVGLVFNWCVRTFLFNTIQDTQCGFKMFKREIMRPLFSKCHLRGFGFDIEMLYLAHKMGYQVKEGPVSWRHVHGSKVNLVVDSVKIGRASCRERV